MISFIYDGNYLSDRLYLVPGFGCRVTRFDQLLMILLDRSEGVAISLNPVWPK